MCQCLVKKGVASARAHKLATPSRKPPEEPDGHPGRPMDLSQASGYPPDPAIGGNDDRGRPPWATLVMRWTGGSLFPAEPAPAPGLLVVSPTPPRASGLFPTGGGLEAWHHVILTVGFGSGRIEGRPYPCLDGPHGPAGGGPNLGWAPASSSDTPMLFPAKEPEQEDQPPKRHTAFTSARGAAKRWEKQKDTLAATGAARAAEAEAKGEEQGEEQEEGGISAKQNKATEATPKSRRGRVGVASGSRRQHIVVEWTLRTYVHTCIYTYYVRTYFHTYMDALLEVSLACISSRIFISVAAAVERQL